jgi:hypothetical protein
VCYFARASLSNLHHGLVGHYVYRLEDHQIVSLFGHRVRVRQGLHTFEGTLVGPSEKRFQTGPFSSAYGVVLEGAGYTLEFAWWDWKIKPLDEAAERIAAE